MTKKVVIIGLDGATWDILEPWARQGKLSHVNKIVEGGIWGKLESTLPPVTGPAWVSFATGKNPGKHGCCDFVLPKGSLGNLKPITGDDIKGKTFYEILDESGRRCIIVNLPASYPPKIKRVVITSLLTQGDDFIFPPNLKDEIIELSNYRILPNMSLRLNKGNAAYIEDIIKLAETRFECAKKLFQKDWDFFFLLFSGTDWIQHVMFDKLVSRDWDENSLAMKFYQAIDEYLGWFAANAPQDANIFIMSDHGFKAYEKSFYVNEWLKQETYLVTEPKTRTTTPRTRGDKELMKLASEKRDVKLPHFLLNRKGLLAFLAPFYKMVRRILPYRIEMDVIQPKILQTTACSISSTTNVGGIYINDKRRFTDGKVEAHDYQDIRDKIIDKLRKLVNTKTGEQVMSEVWKKEEIYSGAQLDIAPDIVFTSNEYVANISLSGRIFTNGKSNRHALNGIFLAYGPDIKGAGEIQVAKIYDLAPTVLHIFDLPVPDDMDGRVLKEIFKEGSEPARRGIKYQSVDGERERVGDKVHRLKKLGKL